MSAIYVLSVIVRHGELMSMACAELMVFTGVVYSYSYYSDAWQCRRNAPSPFSSLQ